MRKRIEKLPDAGNFNKSTFLINEAIKEVKPYKLNLSDEEKKGNRSMAEGREGYVRLVSKIAAQHPDSLSRSDDPAELKLLLDHLEPIRENRMALLNALEITEELELGISMDIMTLTDRYVRHLQLSREHDGAVDLALREVDEWNKRFANNGVITKDPETPIS